MIPITFNKDDVNNVKKGSVRGQDLASFLSISMPKRAGILDIFSDPCGYVQITPTTGYATVTMKKGYINIFGRCIYVEQGEQVQIALPSSGSTTGTFGIRIDLGETGANEVAWFTKTTTLQQDNILNNEVNGVYEFGLYTYTATSSTLTLTKIAPIIQNIDDYLKGANFTTQATNDNSTKLATTAFVQSVFAPTSSFITVSNSDITHYVSNTANRDVSNITAWTSLEGNLYFKKKTVLQNKVVIYTGYINNPSGKGRKYWYKLDLPDDYASKDVIAFAIPVTNYVSAIGGQQYSTNVVTYRQSKSVYICRDAMGDSVEDRPNVQYMIIVYL